MKILTIYSSLVQKKIFSDDSWYPMISIMISGILIFFATKGWEFHFGENYPFKKAILGAINLIFSYNK